MYKDMKKLMNTQLLLLQENMQIFKKLREELEIWLVSHVYVMEKFNIQ
jgi:hypothetical protein